MQLDGIPQSLKQRPQWVLWRYVVRDGRETKVPFSTSGEPARTNDPSTWSTFDIVVHCYEAGGYSGIGYVFGNDPFCGIDLDGCRDPDTGIVDDWAREIIQQLDTYAEVSPTGSGVKLFVMAQLPPGVSHKREIPGLLDTHGKQPAIEAYDRGRYFAVTGERLVGPTEPQPRQQQLDEVVCQYLAPATPPAAATSANSTADFGSGAQVVQRARLYLARIEPAISGRSGHNTTFRAACILTQGFVLERNEALALLGEWNQRCQPPWSQRELEHKVDDALQQPGQRGYLRDLQPAAWNRVAVPDYRQSATVCRPMETLADAAQRYLDDIIAPGEETLIETGLSELDYAIGGGVEQGEMIILAARPSHGKSAVALQCAHVWTQAGRPTLFISEEMSTLALGKRTLQFTSEVPQEHWRTSLGRLEWDLDQYRASHAKCWVAESCGTIEAVEAQTEQAIAEHGTECVIVDYAQLLRGGGRSRYEQITDVSIKLRQLATRNNLLLLVLCQMSRDIERRARFEPVASDLKDSGQLEQDADVVLFCCWPHQLDPTQNRHDFQFFIAKNRNRPINQHAIQCRFDPSRQRFTMPPAPNFARIVIPDAGGNEFPDFGDDFDLGDV